MKLILRKASRKTSVRRRFASLSANEQVMTEKLLFNIKLVDFLSDTTNNDDEIKQFNDLSQNLIEQYLHRSS